MTTSVRAADETLRSSSEHVYDLGEEVRHTKRSWKIGQLALAVLGIIFVLLGVWILFDPSIGATAGANYVLTGLLWAIALIFLLAPLAKKLPPPIAKIRLTHSGVALVLESGQELLQDWSSPNFGLTLRDQVYHSTSGKNASPHLVLFAPEGWFGSLPESAAAGIIQAARERGLPVSTRQETVARGRGHYEARITRIGLPDATPDPR